MAEYIDREALIKDLKQRIKENNSLHYAFVDDDFIDIVKDAPTEDVVEVVRCKDCKWWEKFTDMVGRCEWLLIPTTAEWYCASRERRK